MRVLIVGESGTPAWAGGPSTTRLCQWFGVRNPEELAKRYDLANYHIIKDTKTLDHAHFLDLVKRVGEADLVFLVGKEAQRAIYKSIKAPFWLRGKYAGLPHPSGRNRQLNDPALGRMTQSFVMNTMALFECAPDRPLDVPKELNDVQVDSKHDSVQHDDVPVVPVGGVYLGYRDANAVGRAASTERGPRRDAEAGAPRPAPAARED